jgi:hypothetical protein
MFSLKAQNQPFGKSKLILGPFCAAFLVQNLAKETLFKFEFTQECDDITLIEKE